jgi:hypothetical protein
MKKLFFLFGFLICFTLSSQAQTTIKPAVWYKLLNGKNNRKIANNGAKKKGAFMVVKNRVLTGGHWKFVPQKNGLYRILNKDSKMFLASFGATKKGSQIRQTNTPGSGALWRVIRLQGGRIMIQNNASLLFLGIIADKNNAPLVQLGSLSERITWSANEVKQASNSTATTGNAWPKNTNINAFKPTINGGRIAKVVVRYTNQISFIGAKPKVGERVFFFPQQLANANPKGISFDPKRPPVCRKTYIVTQVSPKIKFNKPMPNLRNYNNDNFMFVVEVFK